MKQFKFINILVALMLTMASCMKDKDVVLTTISVTDTKITTAYTSATIKCQMTCNNTTPIVCYSTSQDFADASIESFSKQGDCYIANLSNLQPETTYYLCYKLWNGNGYLLAERTDKFTTSSAIGMGTDNGHEYVDLGLSVKWATSNVGNDINGSHYAWGETSKETDYSWSTYKYCCGSENTMTKYCTNSAYGVVDNITTLDIVDDAASANWGGNWRIPTEAEWNELITNCTWTWSGGLAYGGYYVKSNIVGNTHSIFIPTAGYKSSSSSYNFGSRGDYWSSSLNESNPNNAWGLSFGSGGVGTTGYGRYYGLSVRAVCP